MLVDRAGLTLRPGEVVAVTGGPGAGKSLLLRALAGLPLGGLRISGTVEGHGRRILVAQDGLLAPNRTLAAQAATLLRHHLRLPPQQAVQRLSDALDRLGAPAAGRRFDAFPHELSDLRRWRAVLALALAAEPAVLLADAPGAGLDGTVRARLLGLLAERARAAGIALVLTARPEDGLDGLADRHLAFERGRLVPAAKPEAGPDAAGETAERNAEQDAGRPGTGPGLLSVRGLGLSFPLVPGRSLTVLRDVSFTLAAGETVALLGESGSGKSMVTRTVLALIPPDAGQVTWRGRDIAAADADGLRRIRRDVTVLFPHPAAALDPAMSVGAQMAETLEQLRPDIPEERHGRRIADALGLAGLPGDVAARLPATLDAEEAARVGLARALLPEPRALVCDEPAASLSGEVRRRFVADLLRLRDERRLALLLAAQDAGEALRIADRALVLMMGRVIEEGGSAALLRDARHPYTRALIAASAGRKPDLDGEAPAPLRPPSGCPLRLRCPKARGFCGQEVPALEEVAPGHRVACHYWDVA
ncbi:ABC transporter [Azospirillum thermophilum]|uniref:ABC transporter n=2 Tax=Azospirillum thermophilum TaxID=2202148 RepID=A0A2S2CUA3_9PROT|nr:ABC transporter [Azospirillum thermophilum]